MDKEKDLNWFDDPKAMKFAKDQVRRRHPMHHLKVEEAIPFFKPIFGGLKTHTWHEFAEDDHFINNNQ